MPCSPSRVTYARWVASATRCGRYHHHAFKNISLQYTRTATPADGREIEPENCGAPADH